MSVSTRYTAPYTLTSNFTMAFLLGFQGFYSGPPPPPAFAYPIANGGIEGFPYRERFSVLRLC